MILNYYKESDFPMTVAVQHGVIVTGHIVWSEVFEDKLVLEKEIEKNKEHCWIECGLGEFHEYNNYYGCFFQCSGDIGNNDFCMRIIKNKHKKNIFKERLEKLKREMAVLEKYKNKKNPESNNDSVESDDDDESDDPVYSVDSVVSDESDDFVVSNESDPVYSDESDD